MIRLYGIMLFVHVTSDIGLFIGIGVQLAGLAALRRAKSTGQGRVLVSLIHSADTLAVASVLFILGSGLYMALTAWNLRVGWLATALGTMVVLIPPVILVLVEPRMRAVTSLVRDAAEGPLPKALHRRIQDPLLVTGVQTQAALVLGIVFLMTTKPALGGSILAMALFLLAGLASGLPYWLSRRLRDARSN
jgi:hypothetical protein